MASSTDFLHGVEVVEVDDGIRPIQTLKASIIGLVGTAGKGDLNVPTLVTSRREAVTKFGEWDDRDGFTIPEALDAIFDQAGATVVVINAFDAATELAAVADEVVTLNALSHTGELAHRFVSSFAMSTAIKGPSTFTDAASGTIVLPDGITVTAVKSSDEATTYVEDTDYSVTVNAGTDVTITNLDAGIAQGASIVIEYTASSLVDGTDYSLSAETGIISRVLSGSKIIAGATLEVDYNYVDPTAAVEADIIGGVNPVNGLYEGVHSLLGAKSELGLQPRILLAPHWTHQKPDVNTRNAVVAEMLGIAERLRAVILADGPNTTDEAAVQYRGDYGSKRVYICDPFHKRTGPSGATVLTPYSAIMAGVIARTDKEVGFWASPSNKLIFGTTGLARPIEFTLGDADARANYLNENRVTCAIREQGFRTWGNRTAAFDQKWTFLNVVRTNDIVAESILQAHLWAVDRNINKGFFEQVVEGVNAYLRYLRNQGAILGGKAWADPDLNTPDVIQNGQVFIDYDFTPSYPAERITFRAHLVNDYVAEIFD